MKELYRQIVSGMIAACVLAGMSVGTGYQFWFCLLVSGGLGLGAYFSIPRKKDPDEIEVAPGVTQGELSSMVTRIQTYAVKFFELGKMTQKQHISDILREIVQTLNGIVNHIKQDPRDLAVISEFFDQYLTRSYNVMSQYVRLSEMPTDRNAEQLERLEGVVRNIAKGFSGFYHQCLENNLIDLEVESTILRDMLSVDIPGVEIDERSQM